LQLNTKNIIGNFLFKFRRKIFKKENFSLNFRLKVFQNKKDKK